MSRAAPSIAVDAKSIEATIDVAAVDTTDVHPTSTTAECYEGKDKVEAAAEAQEDATPPVPTSIMGAGVAMPASMIFGATFINLFVYGVEWSLYAVYFREVYNWSGTLTGMRSPDVHLQICTCTWKEVHAHRYTIARFSHCCQV